MFARFAAAVALLNYLQSTMATKPRTNVLFVVIDNFRPSMGAYGSTEVITPRMDALAASGTLFSRAFCQEAWCSPSRNSFKVAGVALRINLE